MLIYACSILKIFSEFFAMLFLLLIFFIRNMFSIPNLLPNFQIRKIDMDPIDGSRTFFIIKNFDPDVNSPTQKI